MYLIKKEEEHLTTVKKKRINLFRTWLSGQVNSNILTSLIGFLIIINTEKLKED